MAVSSSIDPAQTTARLREWLATRLTEATDVTVSDVELCHSSGLSTETVLFDAEWSRDGEPAGGQFVARIEPAGGGLFMTYDLSAEFRLMRSLGQRGVPVPAVWWHETDRSVLGAEFLIMTRVQGRVPRDDPPFTADGWVLDLDPHDRARLSDNALRALASVHRVAWRAAGLDFLDRAEFGRAGVDQRLGYWEHAYRWVAASGEANPTVVSAMEWLRKHQPSEPEELVVTWGDARIGNMIFADDLSVAAIIDWEIAGLGAPETDLGWWLFMQRHHTEAIGFPLPDGIPDRDQTIERYEALSGRRLKNVHYFEALAALGGAITSHRLGVMMRDLGLLPPESSISISNPASHILAGLLDLPAPDSASQTYIGSR